MSVESVVVRGAVAVSVAILLWLIAYGWRIVVRRRSSVRAQRRYKSLVLGLEEAFEAFVSSEEIEMSEAIVSLQNTSPELAIVLTVLTGRQLERQKLLTVLGEARDEFYRKQTPPGLASFLVEVALSLLSISVGVVVSIYLNTLHALPGC